MDSDEVARSEARGSLWKAAQDGFFQVLDEAPNAWKGRDARFYRTEKKVIMNHMEPFYYGFLVTGFLFATFRISGSKTYIRFRDRYLIHRTPLTTQPAAETQKQWISHIEREAKKKEELRKEAAALPLDLLLSVLCGASSILWLSKPQQMQTDFARAPLLSGRSLIYKYMCPDIAKAYETNVRNGVFHPGDDDGSLMMFETFVMNCKIRSSVISARENSGEQRPDVIPYPGIKGESTIDEE